MQITIVIPTYNEAENLPKLVSALFSLPLDLRLLVVDDNSPDGTGVLAEDLARKYTGRLEVLRRPGKMGLRSAYLNGFQKILDGELRFAAGRPNSVHIFDGTGFFVRHDSGNLVSICAC